MREYDPVTDSTTEVIPFDESRPAAVPLHAELLQPALDWARSEIEGRVLFYSAREELDVPDGPPIAAPKKATGEEDHQCSPGRKGFSADGSNAVVDEAAVSAGGGQPPAVLALRPNLQVLLQS